jgi:hypothetical protein
MRIVAFGDSWTAGHGVEKNIKYKEEPFPEEFIQRLRDQNSWPRWVATKFNCEYINMGVCGYGNEYILKDVINSVESGFIEKDDIVIVMFSYPYRYATKNVYTVIEMYELMEKTLEGITHFYFNSFYPTFKDEEFNTKTLPPYFINPDTTLSNLLRECEIKNNISVWEYGSRSVWNDEKNFYEGDYHPNLLGYRIIGDHIYNQIKDML